MQPSSDLTVEETTQGCENQEVKVTLGATLETGFYTHHSSPNLWQRWAWGTGVPWSRIGPWWWQGKDQGLEPCCECHTPRKGFLVLEAQELMPPDKTPWGQEGGRGAWGPSHKRSGVELLPPWQVDAGTAQARKRPETSRSWTLDALHPAPL